MKRSILAFAGIAAVACMSTAVWAANNSTETIKLYQEPNASAKVVETIKTDIPLITIYKNEGWSKVGDPSNGQTGWVQTVDLKNVDSAAANVKPNQTTKTVKTDNGEKTVTKGTVQTPQGPMNYEIVQFQSKGDNGKVDKAFFKQLQQQQIEMNNVFANSWNDIDGMQMNMSNLMVKQQQQMMEMQKQFQQFAQQTMAPANHKIELKDATPAQPVTK
ncbi:MULTISPECIES: SH3 domain-containing protein [unclassified Photobacterium]|uniref:SH3 domain-containing protein n=1 Tax=unclassified Photobacterium TaxID=2628852 RepID=UPI001EE046E6|nr:MULTISPECIES: SH3 domain-containing protein [unclassified Photobacterium]MCG3865183.1 SH3 domain-containing protein [Photobacterium sp. Ph6]MCG3876682.1 SH3 domain-containing protein [Photobacterium sp. Ph5]